MKKFKLYLYKQVVVHQEIVFSKGEDNSGRKVLINL